MSKLWLNILSSKKGRIFIKSATAKAAIGDGKELLLFATKAGGSPDKWVGSLNSSLIGGVSRLNDIRIRDEFKGLGVAKRMFKIAMKKHADFGSKFLRSSDIVHPAQVKIRGKYKTDFLADHQGIDADEVHKVSKNEAFLILSRNELGRSVGRNYLGRIRGVTQIPSNINDLPRPKLPADKRVIRFIRKNGRIIPIRNKQ